MIDEGLLSKAVLEGDMGLIASRLAAAAVGGVLLNSSPAAAAEIIVNFSGTIIFGTVQNFPSTLLPGGTSFSGSLSYDSSMVPLGVFPNSPGQLAAYGAISRPFSVTAGSISISRPNYGANGGNDIYNDTSGGDMAVFRSIEDDYTVYLEYQDTTGSAFSGISLPTDLSGGNSNLFYIRQASTGLYAVGIPTFITSVAGVPEPATWAMMLFGMAAVGAAMRKQTQRVRFAF